MLFRPELKGYSGGQYLKESKNLLKWCTVKYPKDDKRTSE